MKKYFFILLILVFSFSFSLKLLLAQEFVEGNFEYVPKKLLFLIDCSKKMKTKLSSKDSIKKIDLVKVWLPEYIKKLPYYIPVGMRIYGHDDGIITFDKCDNSDIISYVGFEKYPMIVKNLESIKKSSGEVPLKLSLTKAINVDLNDVFGQKEIIIITNNLGNCKKLNSSDIDELLNKHEDINVNIISLGAISSLKEKKFKHLAKHNSVKYYNVMSTSEFEEVLDKVIIEKPKYIMR